MIKLNSILGYVVFILKYDWFVFGLEINVVFFGWWQSVVWFCVN